MSSPASSAASESAAPVTSRRYDRQAWLRPFGLVAADHPMLRQGLRALLESQGDFSVVGEVGLGEDVLRLVRERRPDILLLDPTIPGLPGLELLARLRNGQSGVRTLLLVTAIEQLQVIKALELGARGILLKESSTVLLLKSIRTVMAGQHWVGRDMVSALVEALVQQQDVRAVPQTGFGLTQRELGVLALIVAGHVNRDIAERLGIAEGTVKHHLTSIFDKTGTSNRLELALFAIHHRLLQSD